jgi:hypothetical protein
VLGPLARPSVLAWPVAAFAEDERYKVTALAKRDARLREFAAAGWRPVDIQRVTGYSRETIRQALKPEARADATVSAARPHSPHVYWLRVRRPTMCPMAKDGPTSSRRSSKN